MFKAEVTIWETIWGLTKLGKHITPQETDLGALRFARRYIEQFGGYAEVRDTRTNALLWAVWNEDYQVIVHSVCAGEQEEHCETMAS
jgi:hypothetical protein